MESTKFPISIIFAFPLRKPFIPKYTQKSPKKVFKKPELRYVDEQRDF